MTLLRPHGSWSDTWPPHEHERDSRKDSFTRSWPDRIQGSRSLRWPYGGAAGDRRSSVTAFGKRRLLGVRRGPNRPGRSHSWHRPTGTSIAASRTMRAKQVLVVGSLVVASVSPIGAAGEDGRKMHRMTAAPVRASNTEGLAGLGSATAWINSPPLRAAELRGKVVLVDIWTYTCVNWLRTLPYVRAWAAKYKDAGLVVIGVHSPEFPFEKEVENVRRAVKAMDIVYPVAVDSEHVIWRAFLTTTRGPRSTSSTRTARFDGDTWARAHMRRRSGSSSDCSARPAPPASLTISCRSSGAVPKPPPTGRL